MFPSASFTTILVNVAGSIYWLNVTTTPFSVSSTDSTIGVVVVIVLMLLAEPFIRHNFILDKYLDIKFISKIILYNISLDVFNNNFG